MLKPHSAWRATATAMVLGWLAVGCAATGTKIISKADPGVAPTGQRILVVSQVAWVDPTWAAAFAKALPSELRKAGYSFRIQSREPLALQADKARYLSEIAEFNPDLVLVIEPGDGTVDQGGRSLSRRFEAGLFRHYTEREHRELVWRATVALEPAGSYITPADMPALARDLVTRLTADGLLKKTRRNAGPPGLGAVKR